MVKLKNGKDILIREAIKEDAKEILDYLNMVGGESDNLLFGENEFFMTLEEKEKFIEASKNSTSNGMFVGIVDGKIVSLGNVRSSKKTRISHQGELAITVLRDYWGLGIGTLMMQEIINFAKASNQLEVLSLGVKAENVKGIALYKKLGFKEIGRFPKYFKIKGNYYDNILMNLYLGDTHDKTAQITNR